MLLYAVCKVFVFVVCPVFICVALWANANEIKLFWKGGGF